MITVLAGGVGAARFLSGLVAVVDPASVTAVVNVADDTVLHGLHISPDIDTVIYTLAGAIEPSTGWGRRDESWHAMEELEALGGSAWFRLGDRDLGTHLYRTGRLSEGASLSTVTAELAHARGLAVCVLPVSDDRLATMVTIVEGGTTCEIGFQDYFVARRHDVPVTAVRFDGADRARPAPGVLPAIDGSEVVVIAPSNPIVSIAPILAVPGVADALRSARDRTVAISPIVAGRAIKGPAERLLRELGHDPSVLGVARLYAEFAATLVIDDADAGLVGDVESTGMEAVVTATVMSAPAVAEALAKTVLR